MILQYLFFTQYLNTIDQLKKIDKVNKIIEDNLKIKSENALCILWMFM